MTADLTNWREPEHSSWGFQNVDKIIKVDVIHKGDKISTLKENLQSLDDFKLELPDQPGMDLASFLSATETDGLVILRDGEIVYEKYDRTNTKESKHIMMSMTKSVTGLVCGILAKQGKLDVNALVTKYVPEVQNTPLADVTVQQCLDMRSGVKYDDSTPEYREAAGWNLADSSRKATDLHEFISTFQPSSTPKIAGLDGAPFEYVSVNTDLMGWIVERASGKKFAELVSELIWQPMGAESDAHITVDRSGNARTAGGMCATTRDIARVGQLLLDDNNGIVPAEWIQDMLHGGSKEAFTAGTWKRNFEKWFPDPAYRSYWVVEEESETLIGIGIHGQMLFADRKNKIVMAKTSSQPERADQKRSALTKAAFKEVQRLLA